MRTAEEILKGKYRIYVSEHEFTGIKEDIIAAINEARKEAIKECAERAKAKPIKFSKEQQTRRCPAVVQAVLDKQSILSLINELK